ncbi:hypothetical protein NUU61_004007 [Penicillium alfredii]|uniref:YMC020W-like alpha/beta hydrolase domain-containing protein n=1 Tax=Penicillium alfredii TaxID=1506179 RepID=A0A9W9FKD4_9EURO|nr:uncharacterized protein NUU61_004007 [Penicillium alfredii]KAJ5101785.1 hypothetical protein NUU61_004007 [Penicillium alfredii]
MTPKGSRKRVKPSPSGADSTPAVTRNDTRDCSGSESRGRSALIVVLIQSWYPGSWSAVSRVSKAAPVTEVARESISVAKNVASNVTKSSTSLLDTPRQNQNPSIQLTRKAGASTRSLPADVTTTRVNIASDGSASTTAVDKLDNPVAEGSKTPCKEAPCEGVSKPLEESAKEQEPTPGAATEPATPHAGHAVAPEQPNGWFSWLHRSNTADKDAANAPSAVETEARPSVEDPATTQVIPQPAVAVKDSTEQEEQQIQGQKQESEANKDIAGNNSTPQKRSWLQMWYGSNTSIKQPDQSIVKPTTVSSVEPHVPETSNESMAPKDQPDEPADTPSVSQTPVGTTKSSGWSFWSKDASKDATPDKNQEAEAVEASLASKTPSRPVSLEPDPEANVNISKKGSMKGKPPKGFPLKYGSVSTIEATSTPSPPLEPRPADATASKQLQRILPNQVLPHFRDIYTLEESPSLLKSLGRLLHYSKGPEHQHVCRVKDPPHIKRALAIGVHGYFPAPLIRSVLGQPTGTSIRFSSMAADAIRKWTEAHGYSCAIEKIALEGEGRIADRVDLLWKLLLNWMEEIRKADFIMVACHSQGVPVAIMLVAKLISFGCLSVGRVGICAMAGVNLGPFSDYRSRWISGSAGELFEFALPFSKVSRDYEAALRCALDFGVRISYIGSIDDQLVSLESSLYSPIAHPYIYRAVFVDGRVHAPSFLSHLVGFALKLRNLGISDHGLIRELSQPLAGSLYTGEGHSRLYDDEAVYHMAIEFALETSSVPDATLNIKRASPSTAPNPYILPFAMRGLLEEEYVRRELHDETMELLRQFDDWKPLSKVLKDVKFRLEGIRSKL